MAVSEILPQLRRVIMATQKQYLANQKNAQRSTGPRTSEGKALASKNAMKHGLLSQAIVYGDPNEFEQHYLELKLNFPSAKPACVPVDAGPDKNFAGSRPHTLTEGRGGHDDGKCG